jgi:tetratricopeptide (TPR) repeat protein
MIGLIVVVVAGIGAFYGYRLAGKPGAVAGAAAGAAAGLLAGLLIRRFTTSMGGAAGGLFSGREPQWTLREQLGADLSQARHMSQNERFDDALAKLNDILKKVPEFPEALLLKARILWDGRENLAAAKKCLRQVIAATPESGSLNREATEFFRELVRIEKFRSEDGPGTGNAP